MLLISFWQVLMFLIAFLSLKQAKNEGGLGTIHGKARLKLNYMKNPSFGELQSLCQISQVCNEENQRRNLTLKKFRITFHHLRNFRSHLFTWENFASLFSLAKFSHLLFLLRNFFSSISHLRNLHVIFRYFAPTLLYFYLQIFCVIIYSLLVISWRSFKIFRISNWGVQNISLYIS